ncbi:unnamed protein product [Pseudo-nitzschia multistriata]|uniref:J domain-containing protein n=1 Tax=Pseudo-nitzschia multistriata TaxID=183589 RepID=A0A448ZS14_9STRA|nr:unnamed protein product [Pseudo-nitzschia multistriata]
MLTYAKQAINFARVYLSNLTSEDLQFENPRVVSFKTIDNKPAPETETEKVSTVIPKSLVLKNDDKRAVPVEPSPANNDLVLDTNNELVLAANDELVLAANNERVRSAGDAFGLAPSELATLTRERVRERFREAVFSYHPDRNPSSTTVQMQVIRDAKDILLAACDGNIPEIENDTTPVALIANDVSPACTKANAIVPQITSGIAIKNEAAIQIAQTNVPQITSDIALSCPKTATGTKLPASLEALQSLQLQKRETSLGFYEKKSTKRPLPFPVGYEFKDSGKLLRKGIKRNVFLGNSTIEPCKFPTIALIGYTSNSNNKSVFYEFKDSGKRLRKGIKKKNILKPQPAIKFR